MSKALFKPVLNYCEHLCEALEHDYVKQYAPRHKEFTVSTGRKYYKILEDGSSVVAFVDKVNGDVFKPASWNSPAKHVRYNLLNDSSRHQCLSNADWAGGFLYLRG